MKKKKSAPHQLTSRPAHAVINVLPALAQTERRVAQVTVLEELVCDSTQGYRRGIQNGSRSSSSEIPFITPEAFAVSLTSGGTLLGENNGRNIALLTQIFALLVPG